MKGEKNLKINSKIVFSYLLILIYLTILGIGASILIFNIIFLIIEVISGAIGFALLAGIIAAYIPSIKSHYADVLTFFEPIEIIGKLQVKWKVEGAINDYREHLDEEIENLLPYKLRIQWVKTQEDVDKFLSDDNTTIILRLRQRENEKWNLASATLSYISEALIRNARIYMNKNFNKALDFAFAEKLLKDEGEISALSYLRDEEIFPIITNTEEDDIKIKEIYEKLDLISEELLTRVFIREIGIAASNLGYKPSAKLEDDIYKFLDWSILIAQKGKDEEVELMFVGKYFKVAIILVANEDLFLRYGTQPYIDRAMDNMRKGADGIYFLARGHNIIIINAIVADINKKDIGLRFVERSDRTYIIEKNKIKLEAKAALYRPAPARMEHDL